MICALGRCSSGHRLSGVLTQCADVVSDRLHHEVGRFANNAKLQPRTPGPHLLLASLGANLDLNGTKGAESDRLAHVNVLQLSPRLHAGVSVPAGDVLPAPGDGDGVGSRCVGVILKPVRTISEIFPLARLFESLCRRTDHHQYPFGAF